MAKEMLSDEDKKRYLENNGTNCPFCEGVGGCITTIEQPWVDTDAQGHDVVFEIVDCDLCGKMWRNRYSLSGVDEMVATTVDGRREYGPRE